MKKLGLIKLSILSMITSSSFAELHQINLKLGGLASDFCAYSLGKKLTNLEGVREAKVQVNQGCAKIILDENKKVSLASIEKAIRNTPYKLKGMSIQATGKIEKDQNNFVFKINNNPYQIYLVQDKENKKQAEIKDLSMLSKIKNALRGILNTAMSKISATEQLHNKVRSAYEKSADIEIKCNVHCHRNGFLLGLSDEKIKIQDLREPKWPMEKNA